MSATWVKPSSGRLLDYWDGPVIARTPVGCIATSYTFAPAFFEEECIRRFLKLQSDPRRDGVLYLMERQERFAQLKCASAIVDQHHSPERRSLRWDLLAARPVQGIMHAKVTLLMWSECLRVIISSANLTENGYRRNREVAGVLDYYEGSRAPRPCLRDVVSFLQTCIEITGVSKRAGCVTRARELLDEVGRIPASWALERPVRGGATVAFLPAIPGSPSVLDRLSKTHWPLRRPPNKARVTSPFFDSGPGANAPADRLGAMLGGTGARRIVYDVDGVHEPGTRELILRAPASLRASAEGLTNGVTAGFRVLDENPARPLHAKMIVLEAVGAIAYMLGSSNFTSRGLGLSPHCNYEANLVYSAPSRTRESSALQKTCMEGSNLDPQSPFRFEAPAVPEDGAEELFPVLPRFFRSVALAASETPDSFRLLFEFNGKGPEDWRIRRETADGQPGEVLIDARQWLASSSPSEWDLEWADGDPPSRVLVSWDDNRIWWAVNAESQGILPAPPNLPRLNLDQVLKLLAWDRPLRAGSAARLLGEASGHGVEAPLIDPLKRVDSSGFLLPRMRRFGQALEGMRRDLETPAVTEEALHWRLNGPVSVMALVRALRDTEHAPEEHAFFLAEIILELRRARPVTAPGSLSARKVRRELRLLETQLVSELGPILKQAPENLQRYVGEAIGECGGRA